MYAMFIQDTYLNKIIFQKFVNKENGEVQIIVTPFFLNISLTFLKMSYTNPLKHFLSKTYLLKPEKQYCYELPARIITS